MKPSYKIKAVPRAGRLLTLCLMAGPVLGAPHVAMAAGRPWPAMARITPQMGAAHRPQLAVRNRWIGGAAALPASGVFAGPGVATDADIDAPSPRALPLVISAPPQPTCIRPLLITLRHQRASGAPLPHVVYGTPLDCEQPRISTRF